MHKLITFVSVFTLAACAAEAPAPTETLEATRPASAHTTDVTHGVTAWQIYRAADRLHIVGIDAVQQPRVDITTREIHGDGIASEIDTTLPTVGALRFAEDGTIASSTLDPATFPILGAMHDDLGDLVGKADGVSCADASLALVQCVSVLPGCADGPFVVLTCPAALIYCDWLLAQAHDACGWWP